MPLYSKHTFLFPFRWDIKYIDREASQTSYNERTDLNKFHDHLIDQASSKWSESPSFETDTPEKYSAWTYFYSFVRKAIFPDTSHSPFKQYAYAIGGKATYQIQIEKKGWASYNKTFDLTINSIILSVYDLGVAMLCFSLENYQYSDPDDILHINDYGRHLYPQYLGIGFDLQPPQNSFLATSIKLFNQDNSLNIQTDYKHNYSLSPAYLPPHILQLLGGTGNTTFAAGKIDKDRKGIRVEPVLDDRMFVLCWYGNNQLARQLSKFNDNQYNLTTEHDFWYRYIFVDTDLTCPDPLLKSKLLQQATYTRWAPDKTLYGISRYSFVILSDAGDFGRNVLSVHLTNIYARLVQMCLVQRATLLRFSGEVSYVSRQLKKNTDLTFTSNTVQELNSSYIQFDNRFLFKEITVQEQGIELYNLLHEQIRLPEISNEVKQEINELNEYVQVANSETQRVSLERLSLLGGLFLIPSFVLSYFGWGILEFKHLPINSWIYVAIIMIFVGLLWVGYKALFAKPNEFFAEPKDRSTTLRFTLLLIVALVVIPILVSPFMPDRASSTQPVIDSSAIQQIDSLRNEIRSLRESLKQPDSTKPNFITK